MTIIEGSEKLSNISKREEEKRLNVRVPKSIYHEFRMVCLQKETTVTNVILKSIEEYIINNQQVKKEPEA